MANTTVHGTLIKYEKSGTTVNQTTIYPKTTAADVSLTKQGNIPSSATTVQALAAALGTLAFKSSIENTPVSGLTTSQFASGVITTALNITAEGKIADARALKTLNDKITTNANNITKLNSKIQNITLTTSGWSGSSAPFSYTINSANITSTTKVIEISPANGASSQQLMAYLNCRFCGGTISSGRVVIYAFGSKPPINIPIVLLVRGEI